jgi:hypothetical protein
MSHAVTIHHLALGEALGGASHLVYLEGLLPHGRDRTRRDRMSGRLIGTSSPTDRAP